MEDINTSFFDGALSKNQIDQMNESDSDESDTFSDKIEDFMSYPLTHWIVISQSNKIYRFICGFEMILCIISSYYYGYMASFHD